MADCRRHDISELVFCFSSEFYLKSESAGSSIMPTRFCIFSISCGRYEFESFITSYVELCYEEALGAGAFPCSPYRDLIPYVISVYLFLESTLLAIYFPNAACIL